MEPISDTTWLLSVLVFVPLAGALLMALIPEKEEELHKQVALLTSLVALGLAAFLLIDFDYDSAVALQYFVDEEWIEECHPVQIHGWQAKICLQDE